MKWDQPIHSGWRRSLGIACLVAGAVSAVFYYTEMHTLAVNFKTSEQAVVATPKAEAAKSIETETTVTASSEPATTDAEVPKIHLSTATQAELETLPGIGPSKAKSILEYREQYGLGSVDELDKVKGIGPTTLEKLKPLVAL